MRLLGALLLLCASAHASTPPVDSISVDLDALIDSAAHDHNRFAVNIAHSISSDRQGRWTSAGTTSTWTYNIRVPTAVSLSFHARLALPPSATLQVHAGTVTSTYKTKDLGRGGLWSRPLLGDSLQLRISVNTAEARQVQLRIDSVQAGYRALGGGVPDHAHYRRLMAAQTASPACTQNYMCNATAANQGPAQATVAVVVANQYQCTGTLLNNTRGDGMPYVLTARHCQTDKLGGGDPGAAESVVIYWDATTACGQTLESIYYNDTTQNGATTVVEQQDAWLIKLDVPPVASDAFYAGWDASGVRFSGGYSIHHALGNDRQYVSWYGPALLQHVSASSLQVGYNSTFWGVVNQLGVVGGGSSGGALFDPNNNVVGSGTLANLVDGTGSAGVCPATPLVAPNSNNVTAQYTALAAVWTSTADTTSTTGNVTLQSVLDPDDTGQMVMPGFGLTPITLSAAAASAALGQPILLSWNVTGAQTCTASGGSANDGWRGIYSGTGSIQVTGFTPGYAVYTLTCASGNLQGHASAQVFWKFVPAVTGLAGPAAPVMAGGTFSLSWSANVAPCVASGGVSGDGWAGAKGASGSHSMTANQVGTLQYTLTCGTGARASATTVSVYVVPPYVSLSSSASLIRVGENVTLQWNGGGATGGQCTPSGGASNDGWNVSGTTWTASGTSVVSETAPGTYTYTLTCHGGGQTASTSTAVIFVSDTPAISIAAVAPQQQVYSTSAPTTGAIPDLLWSSNVGGCDLTATGPTGPRGVLLEGQYPGGSASDAVTIPGQYTYNLQCGALQAATTINWVTTQPPGILSASATRWVANSPYTLSWTSTSGPCNATGGTPSDGWTGTRGVTGTQTITEPAQGTYLFTLTCGSVQSQVAVIVAAPSVTLTASPNSFAQGAGTTLWWNSTLTPCTYLDGSLGASATPVAVGAAGSMTSNPTAWGTYLYTVTCGSGSQAIHATTQVNIPPVTTLTATGAAGAVTSPAGSPVSAPANTPVTLTWNSPGSRVCIPEGGPGNPAWQGALGGSGSATVTSNSEGPVTYQIDCNNGIAQATVNYSPGATTSTPGTPPPATPPAVTPSGSSPSQQSIAKSGGGALDPLWLLLLCVPVTLRARRSLSDLRSP